MSEIESRFLGRPIHSLVAIPTEPDLIFEVLAVVTIEITVLLIVTPCSLHVTEDRNLQDLFEFNINRPILDKIKFYNLAYC
jgi:hypothetical protein